MFKIVLPRLNSSSRCFISFSFKRYFLSDAYTCKEAWVNRLKNPVFQKIEPGNLYNDLDVCFLRKTRVNLLDVDLMINSVRDYSFKNEVEDILVRLRLTPECKLLPERTSHAAIRWYIDKGTKEDLLNALGDRITYGLFPDYYLNNVLMDKYLKERDSVSALKIAVLQMLQEDFDHPIMKVLALHCCYNYLESPDVWESYKEPEPDPDEEVRKVRVRFVRNPYFDDHFDITETNHLVGKTLWLFGTTVDGAVGLSSQLVGLVLYEKYQKCVEFLEGVVEKNLKLHEDAVKKAKEYVLNRPKQPVPEVRSEGSQEKGQEEVKEVKTEPMDESKAKVLDLLEKIKQGNLEKKSLLETTSELVREAVSKNESTDIKHQCEVYNKWEKERENHIQQEIQRAHVEEVKTEIQKMKHDLQEEEEKLFFFENEEELRSIAERQKAIKNSMVFYKGKGKLKESTDDYVPPDVSKKP